MQKRRVKKIRLVILIAFIAIITALIKNNGSLIKMPNKQFASVGNTTQIGDKTFSIANQIENDMVPTLSAGMIPVKPEGEYWTIVDKGDASWFSYANGTPAYMMLNDGMYQSEEYYKMPDSKKLAKAGAQVKMDSADAGSIYMYIPRYAYNEAGDIVYIRQESVVAGTWTIPEVFTYRTEKEDYALAGIWVECNALEENALTNKIVEMNGKDNSYGLISNAKVTVMNIDEQAAAQMLADKIGSSKLDDISNINHAVIRIVNTNVLEPIQEIGVLNSEADQIEISIKYSKNTIVKVLNGNGQELTLKNGKYTQASKDVVTPYVMADSEGNLKEVNFGNVIFIKNAVELGKFRDKVNAGKSLEGYTVIQLADIDMSSVCGKDIGSWEPIGTNEISFAGTYDGRYHTISNLYMNTDQYQNLGLFTQIENEAIIKNLIMENIYIKNTSFDYEGSTGTGGITGNNTGTIENCGIESGNIIATRSSTKSSYAGTFVGGIAGMIKNGEAKNCYNKADVYAKTVTSNYSEAHVGGITGNAENPQAKIINCYNTGKIEAEEGAYKYLGGIVGNKWNSNVTVSNCYNIGEVSSGSYYGGIFGRNGSGGGSLSIKNSYCLENATNGATQVNSDTLKTYAREEYLGNAYIADGYGINNGYPILEWELQAKKILGKAYVNVDEGKIVVEITHHQNSIVRVVNENGIQLNKTGDTIFKETMTSGNHTYTIIDSEGNEKQVSIKLQLINSANDLCNFRDAVNNGNNFAGTTVYQTADIDMSEACGEGIGSWTPIGTGDTYFAGIYDGQYHTISNLYIKSNEYIDLGMFTQSTENTIIQNLVMENVYVESNIVYNDGPDTRVGGIVGLNKGTIKNCGVESGNIKFIKNSNGYSYAGSAAGGITGKNIETGKIYGCYNKAEIYSEVPNQNNSQPLAGGIAGDVADLTGEFIVNCYNVGKITTKWGYQSFVGGIAGDLYRCSNANIKKCYNIGELSQIEYSTQYKGEIVARTWECGTIYIENCYCLNRYNSYGTQVDANTLKTYATDEYLGSAYIADEYDTNNGYPILEWELNAKNIVGKTYVNADEGKIVIEITHHKNPIIIITKLINGIEVPINRINETMYKDEATEGTHTYIVTDSEGNKLQLKIGPIKLLSTVSDLYAFRDAVNAGNNFEGITIYQMANFDLNSNPWIPIGATETYFEGTYDGMYHTISNLYIKTDEYKYAGLFAQTTENTIIKNLVMNNVDIENTCNDGKDDIFTGGIVGTNWGTIERCGIESGNIKSIRSQTFNSYDGASAGGIAGRSAKGKFIECYNKANIYSKTVTNNFSEGRAGGICACTSSDYTNTIINCYNTGEIKAEGYYQYLGGITGDQWVGNTTIQNNYNIGDISSGSYYGGIFGRNGNGTLRVSNSYCLARATNSATQVNSDTLKTYASTLGSAYTNDDGRNNGYPILKWEKEVR